MNKAIYLCIVYLMPVMVAFLPINIFQSIWLWWYVPFSVVYCILIWKRPNNEMMLWVSLTPVVFLSLILIIIPTITAVENGVRDGMTIFSIIFVVAVPIGGLVSIASILLAYGIYYFFNKNGLISNS